MDEKEFNRKEGTIEYDARKRAMKGYATGKKGFLEQMERLSGMV